MITHAELVLFMSSTGFPVLLTVCAAIVVDCVTNGLTLSGQKPPLLLLPTPYNDLSITYNIMIHSL